jgi:hypothetical protein
MNGVTLLFSDGHGQYIPKAFAELYDENRHLWSGASDEDIKILLEGPPHIEYWDAWQDVTSRVYLIDSEGNKWTLWQDGDLWVICDKLMHDEQYEEFFGEPRQ